MRLVASFVILASAVACGGDPPVVSGSFGSAGVTLTHAYARTPLPGDKSIVITILNREIDCDHPQNDSLKNLFSLTLEVFAHGAGGYSVPANGGTFQVVAATDPANPPGNDAVVGFSVTDTECVPQLPIAAKSGRVSIEKLSPPSGSVDATLPTGDHFSGDFAAIKCDPPPGVGAGGACF